MIESDPALVLAGSASSAERAIAQLAAAPADVVLLDFAMSGMGGLQALPAILATPARPRVLVVSSLTIDRAKHSLAALRMGTADTPPKPRPGGFIEDYRTQLLGKIRALGSRTRPDGLNVRKMAQRALAHPEPAARRGHRAEVVAIGA
jgi:two-component system chemotaxis response regulator CheB